MKKTNQYIKRRKHLSQALAPQSIAIARAAHYTFRNADVENEWRQDSTFDYLTGINEAEAILIISNISGETRSIIFCQTKDPKIEVWEGARIGTKAMCAEYQMDEAYELKELDEKMPTLLMGCKQIYFDFGDDSPFDQQIFNWIKQIKKQSRIGKQAPQSLHFLNPLVSAMRLYKDDQEQALMREAGRISVIAHKKAMLYAQTQNNEAQIAAKLEYTMRQEGGERCAFGSIVASGANACTLHYRANNQPYDDNSLMLIDAGTEYQGYASDITTTFPTRGKFNDAQKAIYQAVLTTHQAVLSQCKVGQNFDTLHQLSCHHICEQLVNLDILQGDIEKLLEEKSYLPYYMHRIGHWIGRDVHDVGSYREGENWQPLEAGMALTIEPGIYILPNENVDKKWWNIGVRIEDTILITENGYENLTAGLPRTIEEIETYLNTN
jgi:Xaa-Pro aminopeptidase